MQRGWWKGRRRRAQMRSRVQQRRPRRHRRGQGDMREGRASAQAMQMEMLVVMGGTPITADGSRRSEARRTACALCAARGGGERRVGMELTED